jgi:hypothetical protein
MIGPIDRHDLEDAALAPLQMSDVLFKRPLHRNEAVHYYGRAAVAREVQPATRDECVDTAPAAGSPITCKSYV